MGAPTTSFAISTSLTPPATSASASLTFWHAHADRAKRDLAQRDLRAFVAFGVRPQAYVPAAQRFGQALQIALERVELEDQARGVDFGERHADFGGGTESHGCLSQSSV